MLQLSGKIDFQPLYTLETFEFRLSISVMERRWGAEALECRPGLWRWPELGTAAPASAETLGTPVQVLV